MRKIYHIIMNSKSTQIFIALLIPVLAVLTVLTVLCVKKSSAQAGDFPYALYAENPKSCYPNKYAIEAKIDSQLALIDDKENPGTVLSAKTKNGVLAVFVPNKISENINGGQKYRLSVRVEKNGALITEKIEKL